MSDRSGSGRRPSRGRKNRPRQENKDEVLSDNRDKGPHSQSSSPAVLRGPQSLERLRDRVQQATEELRRLRLENAALSERISKMESAAPFNLEEGTAVYLEEDSETLRRKVTSFIEAIDKYLEQGKEQE